MNKLFGFLICCMFLGFTWACDDDDDKITTNGQITASLGSKEFKTLENITPFRIPVVLSAPASREVTVTGAVRSEMNAKEKVDYTFMSKQMVIPVGKSAGYFEVEIKDYPEYTPDRTFVFEILKVEGAKLSEPDACTVVITSNEGIPVLGFANTMVSVSEEMLSLPVNVKIDRVWKEDITFRLHMIPARSTAVYGEHYSVDTTRIYTIPAGKTDIEIPVTIIDNLEENDDRYFELNIDECVNAELSEAIRSMKVTILDDEEPVFVCFDKTDLKGIESEGPVWIPVRVKGNSKMPVKVSLGIREGTAKEGVDFTFEQRELIFENGKKLDSVRIDFIDNEVYDIDRTFKVGFDAVEGANLSPKDTLVKVTINNDDFQLEQLYEDIMGTWTMTTTLTDQAPASWTVTIHGGNTPEEEDANYMKKWIIHADRYVQGGWNTTIDIPMYYDVTTGEITIGFGEPVTTELNVNGKIGVMKLEYDIEEDLQNGGVVKRVPTTHSKDYKKIMWEKGQPKVGGWGFDKNGESIWVLFFAKDIELIKVDE